MFRKTLLALAAVATVGAAVLAPTAASAKKFHFHGGWHHGHHHHWHGYRGLGVVIGAPVAYYGSCWRYRWVETRYGLRKVMVNVCGY